MPFTLTGPNVPKRMLEAFQMMLDLGPDDPDVAGENIMYGSNTLARGLTKYASDSRSVLRGDGGALEIYSFSLCPSFG